MLVKISVDLIGSPFFMPKEASLPIGAEEPFMELFAHLRLVFGVLWFLRDQFVITMSELAFVCIPAHSSFNPILAKLCLKLCLVYLLLVITII